MTKKILVINGSYRDDGITDQAVEAAAKALDAAGAETEIINLRNYPIEFCLNCRECTQQEGTRPGICVIDDRMHTLIDKIESAQAFILASPTNFGSVTAIFKRFMERLLPYAYWPWEKPYPQYRKAHAASKKALLISSSAAPAFMGRWLYGTGKQLRMTARIIGADPVGTLFTGKISQRKDQPLPPETVARAEKLALKLLVT